MPAEATALDHRDRHHLVRFDDTTAVLSRTVVIATGARYRRLDVPRLEEFEGTGVYYAATEIEARLCRSAVVAVVGGGNSAGQATVFLAGHAAVVRFIGAKPHAGWLGTQLALDRRGFILTGADASGHAAGRAWADLGRNPLPLETSRPGVFAVGDVRSGSIKRVASAVGEGSMAVRLVHEYLAEVGGTVDP